MVPSELHAAAGSGIESQFTNQARQGSAKSEAGFYERPSLTTNDQADPGFFEGVLRGFPKRLQARFLHCYAIGVFDVVHRIVDDDYLVEHAPHFGSESVH